MPKMSELFEGTTAVVNYALAILGLLPSALVLAGLIDIPPSLKQLIALVSGVIGLGTVVILLFLNKEMQQWSRSKAGLILGISLLAGCVTWVCYYQFANDHTTTYQGKPLILPLDPPAELTEIVDNGYNGDISGALHSGTNGPYVYQLIESSNGWSTVLFVFLLGAGQLLIVFGLFGGVLRVVAAYPETEAPKPPPAPA